MKFLLLLFAIVSISQTTEMISEPIKVKRQFKDQVFEGMNKYHSKYKGNSFYEANASRNPFLIKTDTLAYKMKFITNANGRLMWDADATFIDYGEYFLCRITNIKLLKKSGFMRDVDNTNIPIDEIEDTPFNRAGKTALRNEINDYFKILYKMSQK